VTQGGVLALQKVMNGGTPLLLVIVTALIGSGASVASLTYQFTVAQVVLVLADLGASRLLTREIVRGAEEGSALGWLILLRALVACVLWGLALSLPLLNSAYLNASRDHLLVAVTWSVLGTVSMAFYGWHLGRREFRALGRALAWGLAVTVLVGLGAFFVGSTSVTALVWAVGCGRLVEVSIFLIGFDGGWNRGGAGRAVRLCRRGLFLTGQQLSTMVYSRFSLLAVAEVLTTSQFSHFALARSLYSGLSIVPVSLAHSFFPTLVSGADGGQKTGMLASLKLYLARAVPVHLTLVLAVVTGLLVLPESWLGEMIPQHRTAYAFLSAANTLSLATAMIGFAYLALHLERLLFGLSALNALLAFVLTFLLAWRWQLDGALTSIAAVEVLTVVVFGAALAGANPKSQRESNP
jgi:O-antigen/teichoic acid export membrane protein